MGLRGGGGNFGVVTRFEFDLHPVSTVFGGLLMFPFDRAEEVLRAFRAWAVDAPDEAALLAAINCAPREPFVPPELMGRRVVIVVGCWCGPRTHMQARSPVGRAGSVLDAVCQPCMRHGEGPGLQGGSDLFVAGADPPPDPLRNRK